MKILQLTGIFLLFALSSVAQEKPKAYIVSNAHFDSQWNWDVQKSIEEYIPKTLDQNLFLLGKYPNYVFNFEGGIKYYWMKEYYPHQYELIKKYINEGRWHVTGSTWDATDTNIPSPESFTRNILYGQHFFRDEFGVESTDIFLPDCFGFGWTLPTIANHSGLIGFSTQKLQWRSRPFYDNSKIPFEIGLWQGVDGSKIMLIADAHNYTTRWRNEDLSNNRQLQGFINRSPLKTVYHYYGTGDTGGAPTIESVIAVEKGLKGDGPIQIISATSDQMYKDFLPFENHPELPVHIGELLMDVHGTGCYTSQAAMKLYNRRNEILADAAERTAVAADWLGALKYPKQTLGEAWKRFIWHQFHDDLTGTSIPRAYEFSWNDELISLKQFSNVLTSSVGAVSKGLNTQVKGTPLVIYNPMAYPVQEVMEIEFAAKTNSFSVYDESGKQVASQIINNKDGKVKMLISASAPACGYVVYDIRTGGSSSKNPVLKINNNSLENSVYKVVIDVNGDISSIIDKRNQKELVENGKSIRLALFTENQSFSWPAWEILKREIDKEPVSITGDVKISIIENGPLRVALCVERKHGESSFKQYIRLNEGGQNDRIDLYNEVDWQTSNALLKAEFPLSASNPEATYDLGIGAVKRDNNTPTEYEVHAQQWADLTDKSQEFGVSVLNDSKYGWDKPNDNTIRLTLLHTPQTRGGYRYQDKQDLGKHVFTYSIVSHQKGYKDAGIVRKAETLNSPLQAFTADKHKGELGKSFSFVSIDNSKVSVKALKQAEKSDEYIVRVYETEGLKQQSATLTFAGNIVSAEELNGVEDKIGAASFTGKNLNINIKPFNIKTFKVKLASPATGLQAQVSTPVELPYNLKIASYNSFRRDANFDRKGNSFAAELVPEQITLKGVDFKIESCEVPNGVTCNGDTIILPKGNYNKLYLLAASIQKDINASFIIDGRKNEVVVPDYSGFIGQWGNTGHTIGYLKPADIAFVGTHKHNMIRNKDIPYVFTYMFAFSFDLPANATQLILPEDSRIVVFAASVTNDVNNTLIPVSDIMRINLETNEEEAEALVKTNLLLGKPVIEKSGEISAREKAEFAFDESLRTKWCDVSINVPKYVSADLGKEETVRGWSVFHAGVEELDYITKEYSLQVKINESDNWKTVDTVYDNIELETDRLLQEPVKARFIRLLITKPDQSEGSTARIYDFQVY